MPEPKKIKTKPTNAIAVILQNFSQCVFDILQIVKTVIEYPGEYKELNKKYFDLTQLLKKFLIASSDLRFKDRRYELPWDFLYLAYREEKDKKVLYKAETNLRHLLSKIEKQRIILLGDEYKVITGIKDFELKQMLENISGSKIIQPLKINGEDSIKAIQEDEEIQISKNVTKKYNEMKFEFKNKRGQLKFNKSSKWIDLGGYNTRTFKMAKYILSPSSKSTQICDIFEYIKIPKDDKNEELKQNNTRSLQLKKEIIEKTVDELQKSEFLKGHVGQLAFDDVKKTAIIEFK